MVLWYVGVVLLFTPGVADIADLKLGPGEEDRRRCPVSREE